MINLDQYFVTDSVVTGYYSTLVCASSIVVNRGLKAFSNEIEVGKDSGLRLLQVLVNYTSNYLFVRKFNVVVLL